MTVVAASCVNQAEKKRITESSSMSSWDSAQKNYADSLSQLENQSTSLNYDSLGQIVEKIRFDVKTNNLNDYQDGKIPWIRIDSPQNDIKNLIGKDEIVIPQTSLTIIIDYPLSTSYKFGLVSTGGFTRAQLITEISKHYYQIYDDEERTATVKTVPLNDRKIYNRNRTNGKYGIWGHDIGDLVLDEIHVYKSRTWEIFLILQLES